MRRDPLSPSAALLMKIGSLVVHLEEALSSNGHEVDAATITTLQNDPEVGEWFSAMTKAAMLPVKR